jgi:hypothetical protein
MHVSLSFSYFNNKFSNVIELYKEENQFYSLYHFLRSSPDSRQIMKISKFYELIKNNQSKAKIRF